MRRETSYALAMSAVLCATAAPALAQSPAGSAAPGSFAALGVAVLAMLLVGVLPRLRQQPIPVPVRRRRR